MSEPISDEQWKELEYPAQHSDTWHAILDLHRRVRALEQAPKREQSAVLWVMLTEEEIRFLLNVTAFIEKLPESERDKQWKIRENLKTVLSRQNERGGGDE